METAVATACRLGDPADAPPGASRRGGGGGPEQPCCTAAAAVASTLDALEVVEAWPVVALVAPVGGDGGVFLPAGPARHAPVVTAAAAAGHTVERHGGAVASVERRAVACAGVRSRLREGGGGVRSVTHPPLLAAIALTDVLTCPPAVDGVPPTPRPLGGAAGALPGVAATYAAVGVSMAAATLVVAGVKAARAGGGGKPSRAPRPPLPAVAAAVVGVALLTGRRGSADTLRGGYCVAYDDAFKPEVRSRAFRLTTRLPLRSFGVTDDWFVIPQSSSGARGNSVATAMAGRCDGDVVTWADAAAPAAAAEVEDEHGWASTPRPPESLPAVAPPSPLAFHLRAPCSLAM